MNNEDIIKNEEEEQENKKRPILLLLLYIFSLIMFILSGTFTLSTILKTRDINIRNVKMGQVKMELINNEETNIKLIDTYPMNESEAATLKPFEFKVTNEGTLPVIYRLVLQDVKDKEVLDELGGTKLDKSKVNYSLIDSETEKVVSTGLISNLKNGILLTEKILPRYSKSFEFRLWINENAGDESQNKYYVGEIVLEIDEILE